MESKIRSQQNETEKQLQSYQVNMLILETDGRFRIRLTATEINIYHQC